MVTLRDVQKLIAPLWRRVRLIADRAIVTAVTDSFNRQGLQLKVLADEAASDVERFQNYGLTSVPPVGSEALILAVGGRREGLVAIAVEDKRCRPKGLENGEVRLYHGDGLSYITLKKNGVIEVKGKSVNYDARELFAINTKLLKLIIILVATLISALSVILAGIIGWIGLIIPHITRLIFGADNKVILPMSALIGAIFLLLVDNVSKLIFSFEIPIGIVTAIIGIPIFIFVLKNAKKGF